MSKAALSHLVRELAVTYSPKIRVNAVLLGLIDSGQWSRRFEERSDKSLTRDAWVAQIARKKGIPLGRLGVSMEVARPIVFLASPLSSYVTGASLEISGGVSRFV